MRPPLLVAATLLILAVAPWIAEQLPRAPWHPCVSGCDPPSERVTLKLTRLIEDDVIRADHSRYAPWTVTLTRIDGSGLQLRACRISDPTDCYVQRYERRFGSAALLTATP